jgi:RNA polymerase sigma factor (sigma-70 family)
VGKPDDSEQGDLAEESALGLLLDQAISGDSEASEHLVTLLGTRYYQRIIKKLDRLRTGAGEPTLEDVFQDSLIELVDSLKAGGLKDLKEEERRNALQYFQNLCKDNLKNLVHRRKSPALKRRKAQLPMQLADPNARIPGEPRHTEHFELIDDAMTRLSPENALILKMYREGVPYKEMARVTGKKEENLRNLLVRLRNELVVDIARRSDTANLNFQKLQREAAKSPPTWGKVTEAILLLPPKLKEVARFVVLESRSLEEAARRLGENGLNEATARLFLVYERLSEKFQGEFPDALRQMGPRPEMKRLSRGEILAAVDKLPLFSKEAFRFVHVQGHSVEELAENIGDDDTHRAQARLDDAYEFLNKRLNDSFPDAYVWAVD